MHVVITVTVNKTPQSINRSNFVYLSLVFVHNQPNKAYETQYLYIYSYRKDYSGRNLYIEITGSVVSKCSKDYNSCNPYYNHIPIRE